MAKNNVLQFPFPSATPTNVADVLGDENAAAPVPNDLDCPEVEQDSLGTDGSVPFYPWVNNI